MSNKTTKAPQLSNAALLSQVETLTQEKANALQIANIAAQQLLYVETRFAPLLNKKINVWNALFHIKEWLELIREIIKMIQDFKGKFITKPADDTAQ